MRIRILALSFLCAASLFGQARQFSWQNLCFKNPAAPVCQGNDYAVKPQKPAKDTTPSVVTSPFPSAPTPRTAKPSSTSANPALMTVGGIDWRFADPFADALIGLNFSGISASPLARGLITAVGAKQGIAAADLQKIFDGLSTVDQVAISVRNNRMVAMVTGSAADGNLPPPEAGFKMVPVSGGSMLIGDADAVDQAIQRIAMKGAPTELTRSAEARQGSSEFWAMGSAGSIGPQAVGAGLKRFSLTFWIRSRFTSDVTLEFNAVPNAAALQTWQAQLGQAGTVEGNAVHVRTSLEAAEVEQKFGQLAAGPLGPGLAALVQAARYLPVRDTTVPQQTKPVIYGLDGGPR